MMKPIPIFCAVDDGYAPYLAVALRSMSRHTTRPLQVHVLIERLAEEHKQKLLAMQDEYITLQFTDVTASLAAFGQALHLRDYYTKATYYRFFIPTLFPQYERGLYLDCDIIVNDDIAKLYDSDLGGMPLGAINEEVMATVSVFGDYAEKRLGISRNQYFNAGVLVMDLAKLRKIRLLEALDRLMAKHTFPVTQDQDYLNVLFHGQVALLPATWNKTAFDYCDPADVPSLVHFKIHFKPWHYSGVSYENRFWYYAKQTAYYKTILEELESYQGQERDRKQYADLMDLARRETAQADAPGFETPLRYALNTRITPARQAAWMRLSQYEAAGLFDRDIEADPPTVPLKAGQVDYTHRKLRTKMSSELANLCAKTFYDRRIRRGELVIERVVGLENYDKVADRGVILTCNHFHPNDNYAVFKPIEKRLGRKRLWKIIREGNYTSFRGIYGYFFRHCNTLPLAADMRVFKELLQAVDALLVRGEKILIYPEQAMWYNYRKPRPLKNGAFHFAAKSGAPVLPCFITMRDTHRLDADGVPIQAYTVHYLPPIFPDQTKRVAQNVKEMSEKNAALWRSCYEREYGEDGGSVGCDCISL